MKHRWTKVTYPKLSAPPWEKGSRIIGEDAFDKPCPARQHCVQCGAIIRRQTIKYPSVPIQIFAALGAKWQRINKMPVCEGLPAWYEPPMGA